LPRGCPVDAFIAEVKHTSGRAPRTLLVTNLREGDAALVTQLLERGVERIVTTSALAAALRSAGVAPERLQAVAKATAVGNAPTPIELIPTDDAMGQGAAVVYLPGASVLFAGPLVINGPRAELAGYHTERWLARLRQLEALGAERVVPGFGSWQAPDA